MEALTIGTALQANAPVPAAARRPDLRKNTALARMTLRSRTAGRERWRIEALENRPRLAAALELVLSSEEGVERVEANPLTGRVLVHYCPNLISETIEELIRRAIAFGPMTPQEYAERSRPSGGWPVPHLLGLEIACTALKMTLFGSCWPLALGAAGLLFFHHRRG
jgi:Heavy metal associated domain 2